MRTDIILRKPEHIDEKFLRPRIVALGLDDYAADILPRVQTVSIDAIASQP
jgi:hypothetical protein